MTQDGILLCEEVASSGVARQRSRGPAQPYKSKDATFRHDMFNLVALGVLNTIHFVYLLRARGFEVFWWTTMVYFILDYLWLTVEPNSVKSPQVIKIHHIVSALFTLIPFFFPEHNDKMSYVMTVEVNTWLLIARRIMPSQTINALFYTSWIAVRNVLFPYLIWDFYLEYQAAISGSNHVWHPVLLAPILQTGLTLLNLQWTYDLYKSIVRSSSKKVHQL